MKTTVVLLAAVAAVRAYIPAQGTNDTVQRDLSDPSSLKLTWPPIGTFSDEVSYQLARTNSTGYEVVSRTLACTLCAHCSPGCHCPL
jgi:hypothetical protein